MTMPAQPDAPGDMSESVLFHPIQAGRTKLQHRVVLAPLTRLRADKAHVPTDLQAEYYAQRASVPGTLLITEATFISANGAGANFVPGVWSDAQVEGWRKVTNAVHARGSFIFLQIWALGRAANAVELASTDEEKNPGGPYPYIAPSDVRMSSRPDPLPAPRPLTHEEILEYIEQFAKAAENAIKAGFDGVEVHGANGYIVDQFTQTNSNKRTDVWGGSVEGRCKFALAVIDAVSKAVGQDRTALRLSPWSSFQDMRMPDDKSTIETFSYLVRMLRDSFPSLAYLHVTEPRVAGGGDQDVLKGESNDFLKEIWLNEGKEGVHGRVFISAGGFTGATAKAETEKWKNTLVAFGRHFIANPDLPARLKNGMELTKYDRSTFFIPGSPNGYIDLSFADADAEENHSKPKSV